MPTNVVRRKILSYAAFLFVVLPGIVFAEGERIDAFHVQITLEPNGSVLVQEEIVYDFGVDAVNRHGIYRKVPLVFTPFGERAPRTIEISSIMVTDGNGNLLRSQYSGGGNYMQLKIGEPDVLVSGRQRYVIRYTVWGGINQSLSDKDEFYWNVTGNQWDVPIGAVRADVRLPLSIQESQITTACYVGSEGSTKRCVASTTPQEGTGVVNAVRYTYAYSLGPREGMTIAIGIPKDIYAIAPTIKVKTLAKSVGVYRWWRSDFLGLSALIPVLVFALMFRMWWTNGRDPKGRGTIITEYDVPEHLNTLELAYLKNTNLSPTAISAAIVDFAVRGFLKIERIVKKVMFIENEDFRITFLSQTDISKLSLSEKILYDELKEHGNTFLVSTLSHKMASTTTTLSTQLATDLTVKGYYIENPQIVVKHYLLTGAALFILGMFLPYGNFALAVSGVIVLVFAFLMPKRTTHGALVHEQILGFEKYLSVAEKDRIDFANAPEKNPTTFERFLPYAMILGVEEAWGEKFANMYTEKNSSRWYSGGGSGLSAATLVGNMGAFGSSTARAFTTSGGASGGGGSSGGGGGGGGGGSW